MDLHTWITQHVDEVDRLLEENEFPPSQTDGVRRRCEADRRILARHRVDPDASDSRLFATACHGCGTEGECDDPVTENVNDCPELLDLAHAHGITPDVLAELDRPQPPEPKAHPEGFGGTFRAAFATALTTPITTSDVPEALRGPRWKP